MLTDRQKVFCDEYLKDLNATRAAIAAGYSKKHINTNATKILQKTDVQAYIDKRMQERSQRTKITQDRVLLELAKIAFANTTDYSKVVDRYCVKKVKDKDGKTIDKQVKYKDVDIVATDELTKDQQAAIASIKQNKRGIEVKLHDKVKALELLGRHLNMFVERTEVTGKDGGPIEIDEKSKMEIIAKVAARANQE